MEKTTAGDIMTRGVLTVDADWSVAELATFLEDHAISGAPVVDRNGAVLGVVSVTDIARGGTTTNETAEGPHPFYSQGIERALAREEISRFRVVEDSSTVRDIMTPMIFSVYPSTSVREVADTMIRGRIHRLYVMDGPQLVGVISSLDMLTLVRDA